jgi:hypothetical protein
MSFLARIAMRAGLPGEGPAELPLLVPKNRGPQRPPHLTGQQVAPKQEGTPTLRRQLEPDSEEEEVGTIRRQPAIHGGAVEAAGQAPIVESMEQMAPPAARGATSAAEGEETEPARHIAHIPARHIARLPAPPMEEEEDIEEDGEAAAPLRRSPVVRRAVRGAPAPAPGRPGPEISPAATGVFGQPESLNRGASGAATPVPLPSEPPISIPVADRPDAQSWRGEAITVPPPPRPAETRSEAATARPERPQVVIEQLDVLIHEPVPPPVRGPDLAKRRSRSLRARYLGRL